MRAAELYLAYGDEASAAAALDRLPARLLEHPAARLIEALARIKLPRSATTPICGSRYSRTAASTSTPLASTGKRRAVHALPSTAPAALQRRLRIRLAHLAQELEQLAEAESLLEASQTQVRRTRAQELRLMLMTKAIVEAKRGRLAEADELVDESDAVQGARHLRLDAESAQVAMEKARLLGDWHGVLKMSEEALYAASRSGVTSRIVEAGRAVASAAWYCNDDARLTAARQLLEDCGDGEVRAFDRCVETALARGPVDAPAHTLQTARWHAALATTDGDLAKDLFDAAIEGIDAVENGFLQIAIRVCRGAPVTRATPKASGGTSHRRADRVSSASGIPRTPDRLGRTGELRDIQGDGGRVALAAQNHRNVFYLDVLRGRARRGSDPLPVSDRGLELLAALALLPSGTSKEELAAAIWPALHGDDALNALKMCVSRTRAQAGDKDVIQSTKGGYALNECVAVDVRDLTALLRSARGADSLAEPVRRQLRDAVAAIETRNRAQTSSWAWFAPHATHLDELRDELAAILAKELRRSFDFDLVVATHPVDQGRSAPSDDEDAGNQKSERAEVVGRPA